MKVLVVEDNPLNMELMLEVMNSMGFTVHGAVDGNKAAERIFGYSRQEE